MKTYFDFTPYVTNEPTSFYIKDENYALFIYEQLQEQNIPVTYHCHKRIIDEGGSVQGTPFIAPPMTTVDKTTFTAPLKHQFIERLLSEDLAQYTYDTSIHDAYYAWLNDKIENIRVRQKEYPN